MVDSTGKFVVLSEEPKFFLTTQDNKTIKVPKNAMSNNLQEFYRSKITKPSQENVTQAPIVQPMQAPAIQPQQQMPQAPIVQPMQPKGPNAGFQQQLGAAEKLGELEGEKSQALFDINKQKADMLAQSPEEQVRNDPRFQQAFEQLESLPNEILKRNEELSNFKIDPNRLWNKSSTGQKITGFLGLVLSGIGSGLTGKSNSALDVITRAIENDIDSQKEEKGALKESIMGMQTAYKTFKDFIGDEKAAKLMTLNTGLQRLQLLGDATAEKYSNLQAKERWALERGNIEQKIIENNQQISDIYTANKFKELEQLYKTMNTERQFGLEREKLDLEKEKLGNVQAKEQAKLAVGNLGSARTEREAIAARETLSEGENFIRKLDELIALRKEYGSETLPNPIKSKMESLHGQLLGSYKNMQQLGTLDRGVLQLFDKILSSPTGYGFRVEQYKAFRNQAEKDLINNLKSKLQPSPETSSDEILYNGKKYVLNPDGSMRLK